MVINGSPIPNGYDNTYDTAEVSRPDMDRRANWAEENPEAPQYIRNKEEGSGSGSGGDCGYSCSEERVTLTDESVTTEAPTGVVNPVPLAFLSYSEPIEADTIKVTFDGTVYECEKKTGMGVYYCYGADVPTPPGGDFDWSQYPFAIMSDANRTMINTETAGTYQVKIETLVEVVETSECFDRARGYSCSGGITLITSETINSEIVQNGEVGE